MTIKKIEGELVVIAVPSFKDEGKHIHITGTPEELDESFISELSKPIAAQVEFQSNAAEVATEVAEEKEEEKADTKKETEKSTKVKKAPVKKAAKKVEPVVEDEAHEAELTETLQEEVTAPVEETENSEILNNSAETQNEVTEEPQKATEDEIIDKTGLSFNEWMELGKILFADRKYKEAEEAFSKAIDLSPENEKAKAELKKATQWVKAVSNLGI